MVAIAVLEFIHHDMAVWEPLKDPECLQFKNESELILIVDFVQLYQLVIVSVVDFQDLRGTGSQFTGQQSIYLSDCFHMVGFQGVNNFAHLDHGAADIGQVHKRIPVVQRQGAVRIQQTNDNVLFQNIINQLRGLCKAQLGVVSVQQFLSKTVEGPDHDFVGVDVQALQSCSMGIPVKPGTHLGASLVGEGNHQDLLRLATLLNETQGTQGDDGSFT